MRDQKRQKIKTKQDPIPANASPQERKRIQARNRKRAQRSRRGSPTHHSSRITHHGSKAPQANSSGGWQLRPNTGQGPYTKYFNTFFPMRIDSAFYEFLRESIPIIDAAINRLISLDGHIIVKGNNAKLVEEIQDWIDNVSVNDIQTGMQAFHQSLSNEAFEQGFGLGEFVTDKKRTDIVGLYVGDSKFIKFERKTNTSPVEIFQKVNGDNDWRPLDRSSLMYFSIGNENQNPQGVPLMRGCEFVSKILKTIENSVLNVWERFGDPSFSIIYKTSKRDGVDLESRRKKIEDEFNIAMRAKREGKSADFVRAIDQNSEIEIKVIGSEGEELNLEIPARHVLEQIVSKTGLAPWMLGMHWSTTERLSNAEAELILADVSNRQAAKLPLFTRLVKTLLLLRGRAWKPKDWWLEFAQVNLHDIVAQAQARFLNGQADMYYMQNAVAAGISLDVNDLSLGKEMKQSKAEVKVKVKTCGCSTHHPSRITDHGLKEIRRTFDWPELDKIKSEYETSLKDKWAGLKERILTILKLTAKSYQPSAKSDPPGLEAFTFTDEQRAQIRQALTDWLGELDLEDPDSVIKWYYGQAYSLGLLQAVHMIAKERPILDIIKNQEIFNELCNKGFELVKDTAKRNFAKIKSEMEAQMLAGTNPRHVADRLEKLFGDANSDWERLARSEMSMAAERAKLDEWKEWGVKMVEFTPAPDACSICISLAGDYPIAKCPLPVLNTHPRCRCSIRPAESET